MFVFHFCVFTVIRLMMKWFSVTCLEVIATMRDLRKKERLVEAAGDTYGKTLTLLSLDVCSDDSVRQCISSVKDRHIDILGECTMPLTSYRLFLLLQGKSDNFFRFFNFLKKWACIQKNLKNTDCCSKESFTLQEFRNGCFAIDYVSLAFVIANNKIYANCGYS